MVAGLDAAEADTGACAALGDELPQADADADAVVRYADRLAGCGHDELAEGLYRETLSTRPGPEVRLRALSGLAASLARQGRADEAERVYAAIIGRTVRALPPEPVAIDARQGLRRQRRALRVEPHAGTNAPASLPESVRIDGAGLRTTARGESRLLSEGGSTVSARVEDVRYEVADRAMGLQVTRPGLGVQQRLGPGMEMHGNVAADRMEWRGLADASTRWTYDTGFGLQRDGLLRLQIGSSRMSQDNIAALQRGGIATAAKASVALTPDEQSRYALHYERGALSDGSQSTAVRAETEHRLDLVPNLWLGGRVAQSDSSRPGASGYASLAGVASTMLTLKFENAVAGQGGRFGYGVALGLGNGLLAPEPDRPLYDLSLRGSWQMAPGALLEARLQSLGSGAPQSGLPVHRTAAGVNVNLAW